MEYSSERTNGTSYTSSDKGSNSGGGFGRNYADDYGQDYGIKTGNFDKRDSDSRANYANQVAAAELAANNQSARFKDQAQFSSNLANQNQGRDFDYSMQALDKTQGFKGSESQKDRNQRAQEFADNQFMQRTQMAQGRADLEYTTQQGQKTAAEAQQASQRLRDSELANATGLANINQQTQFGQQRSQIEQAQLAAKAQIQAALFGSKPGYVGY